MFFFLLLNIFMSLSLLEHGGPVVSATYLICGIHGLPMVCYCGHFTLVGGT